MPIEKPEKYGFVHGFDGYGCHLTHRITDEDWSAINERFELPSNIGFLNGLLRDNDNWIDFMGHDTIMSHGVEIRSRSGKRVSSADRAFLG